MMPQVVNVVPHRAFIAVGAAAHTRREQKTDQALKRARMSVRFFSFPLFILTHNHHSLPSFILHHHHNTMLSLNSTPQTMQGDRIGRCCAQKTSGQRSVPCMKDRRPKLLTCPWHKHVEEFVRKQLAREDHATMAKVIVHKEDWMAPLRETGAYTMDSIVGESKKKEEEHVDAASGDEAQVQEVKIFAKMYTGPSLISEGKKMGKKVSPSHDAGSSDKISFESLRRAVMVLKQHSATPPPSPQQQISPPPSPRLPSPKSLPIDNNDNDANEKLPAFNLSQWHDSRKGADK
ncbi:hypothetical protein IWX90DRAFT_86334 [Phyllosticta citrichinensis]|uniref:Uncharacterized protein n=1 Tax=Phyllosticta citrichinensis TaxID=1130410 RepID=A0ABR1XFI3_9PEZI